MMSDTMRKGPFPGEFRAVLPVIVAIAAVLVLFAFGYLQSIRWIIAEWGTATGSLGHGYLVVIISFVLFARAVPSIGYNVGNYHFWTYLVLLALSIAWLLSYVASVVAVQALVLPAILFFAYMAAFGWNVARHIGFPILFLYFAVPAWEHLQFIFQIVSVKVVVAMIQITDIPALVEGNFVHLSSGIFEIAGGCSGLNYVVSGLSLAALYGHLYFKTMRQVVLLTVLMTLVAMIGNWIRIFSLIVIGYKTEMQSQLVYDHLALGWVIFAILLVPVYFAALRLETGQGEIAQVTYHPKARQPSILAILAATLVMSVGPVWALSVSNLAPSGVGGTLVHPDGAAKWVGPKTSDWDWSPIYAGAQYERLSQYSNGEVVVLSYTNLYPSQRQDHELIYYNNAIYGNWRRVNSTSEFPEVIEIDAEVKFRQVIAANYAGDWLIWYRYQIGNGFNTSDASAKIAQAINTLRRKPEAGVIAFATRCIASCAAASATLEDFAVSIGNSMRISTSEDTL